MKNKILIASLIIFLLNVYAYASPETAIVGLYADRENGTERGTGFFVTKDGHILTAYHVVCNCKSLKAIDSKGYAYNNLIIDFIAPNRDLALLKIDEKVNVPSYLSMIDRCPTVKEDLVIIGYPRGIPNQIIPAKTSQNTFLQSYTFRTTSGKRLFNHDIDLVPVVIYSAYYGMSGAPVISNGQAVGVFSGSLNEGGAISWAIPCKYYNDLHKLGKKVSEITQWPPLTLMSNNFNDLNRSYRVDYKGERYLEEYLTLVSKYSKVTSQIPELYHKFLMIMAITKPLFNAASSNNDLLGNKNALKNYLEYPMSQIFESLEGIQKITEEKIKLGHAANNKYFELENYVNNLQLSQKQKNEYHQKLYNLKPKMISVASFHDEMQILDNQSTQILPKFAMIMSTLEGPYSIDKSRQFINGILGFLNDFEPIAQAYSSQKYVKNFIIEVSLFRSLGAAYENIIFY